MADGQAVAGPEPVFVYRRNRPEETLLYRIVEQNYPTFAGLMDDQGRPLPSFVRREFEDYLKCGRLEHGFLRVRCEACHAEKLLAFSAEVQRPQRNPRTSRTGRSKHDV